MDGFVKLGREVSAGSFEARYCVGKHPTCVISNREIKIIDFS